MLPIFIILGCGNNNLVQYLKNVKALHKRASASLAAKDVAGTDQESVFAGLVLCQL